MAVLVDTSVLVEHERGALELDEITPSEERAISVVTVSELLHGLHRAPAASRTARQVFVEGILARFEAVDVTELVARVHAEIWAQLEAAGSLIGTHDLWIAATALTRGWGVVTHDTRDFCRVPGLRVVAVS